MKQISWTSFASLIVAIFFANFSLVASQPDTPSSAALESPTVTIPAKIATLSPELTKRVTDLQGTAHEHLWLRSFDAAKPLIEEAYAICKEHVGEDNFQTRIVRNDLEFQAWVAALSEDQFRELKQALEEQRLGYQLFQGEKYVESVAAFQKGTEAIEKLNSPLASKNYVNFQFYRALALVISGQITEAMEVAKSTEKLVRELAGEESLHFALMLEIFGGIQARLGNAYECIRCCTQACRLAEACGQIESSTYFKPLLLTLDPLIELEEYDLAKGRIEHAMALAKKSFPPDSEHLRSVLMAECALLYALHRDEDAKGKMFEILDSTQRATGAQALQSDGINLIFGLILIRSGQAKTADTMIRSTCARGFAKQGVSECYRIGYSRTYAELLLAEGENAEAARFLEDVFRAIDKEGAKDIALRRMLKLYVQALTNLGRTEEAKQAEEKRVKICDAVEEMRRRIVSDPECKLPWEK